VKLNRLSCIYIGVNSVDVKTEADDVSQCSLDNQPTAGVVGFMCFSVMCYSYMLAFIYLCVCLHCFLLRVGLSAGRLLVFNFSYLFFFTPQVKRCTDEHEILCERVVHGLLLGHIAVHCT